MAKNECPQTRELCRLLERQGALTYPLRAGRAAPLGWTDRFFMHQATGTIFFEAKVGRRQLEIKQRQRIEQIRACGEVAIVVRLFENRWLDLEDVDGSVIESMEWSQFLWRIAEIYGAPLRRIQSVSQR